MPEIDQNMYILKTLQYILKLRKQDRNKCKKVIIH